LPISLSTQIWPCWASTAILQKVKPRPVPRRCSRPFDLAELVEDALVLLGRDALAVSRTLTAT
jgi:hypothetical protein